MCRITAVQKFKTRSGFKQYDVILTKEQLVMTKRKSSFEAKNMHSTMRYVLGLIYILMTLNLQQKLMKVVIATEILTMKSIEDKNQ